MPILNILEVIKLLEQNDVDGYNEYKLEFDWIVLFKFEIPALYILEVMKLLEQNDVDGYNDNKFEMFWVVVFM